MIAPVAILFGAWFIGSSAIYTQVPRTMEKRQGREYKCTYDKYHNLKCRSKDEFRENVAGSHEQVGRISKPDTKAELNERGTAERHEINKRVNGQFRTTKRGN